jgi:hypothetical protein
MIIVPVIAYVVTLDSHVWLTGHRDLYEGVLLARIEGRLPS